MKTRRLSVVCSTLCLALAVLLLTGTELFSTFGTYELTRAVLPEKVAFWGPSWC